MSRTPDQIQEDYKAYRGKCKQLSEQAVKDDPTLTLVRGHYWCPIWGTNEGHWWTVRPDGTIYDPSSKQFPSDGHGEYTPFDGTYECAECSKRLKEDDPELVVNGNYIFCSTAHALRFVGL